MAVQKMRSAKKKRRINNVIVHTSLAVLAGGGGIPGYFIYGRTGGCVGIPDYMGSPYKFSCGKRVLCIYIFPKRIYAR